MKLLAIIRAALSRLAKITLIPGEREALDAHLASSVDVNDAEARMRAWDQRQRNGNGFF